LLKLLESSAPAKLLTGLGSSAPTSEEVLAATSVSVRFPARISTLSIFSESSSTLAVIPVAISRGVPDLPMKKSEGTGTTLSGKPSYTIADLGLINIRRVTHIVT